mgnify:CR=1 FL=1
MEENIKKTLEEQLQLLSERSKDAPILCLAELTAQMVNVAKVLDPELRIQCHNTTDNW